VIVLTARGDLVDRVAGLDIGADDCLAKPFAIEELLARLRAVLRRPVGMPSEILNLGRLSFDFGHREASIDGQPLVLPRRELLVLELGSALNSPLRTGISALIAGLAQR